jgi:hypothetical protein
LGSLSLGDPVQVSEEDKAEALKLKAAANKAFASQSERVIIRCELYQ